MTVDELLSKCRISFRLPALAPRKHRKRVIDAITLENYRTRIGEYDRWLSDMPDICRLLENLKAQCEWNNGTRPVDIAGLRDEIRAMRNDAARKTFARGDK